MHEVKIFPLDKQTIEERLDKLEKENREVREENKKLRKLIKQNTTSENTRSKSENVSRRQFLKKLGAGAIGLGAASLIPNVAGFDIKSSDGLEVWGDGTKHLNVPPGGPVQIENANLDMAGNNINNAGSINIDEINSADLANSTTGSVPTSQGDGTMMMEEVEGVPSGLIAIWSGTIGEIPDGWTLCDGNNGAPDLRDRFVVGAGSSYSSGDTGGQDQVTLTEEEMPSHTHDLPYNVSGGNARSYNNTTDDEIRYGTPGTESAGGDQAHENRPPYYALAYIMKT